MDGQDTLFARSPAETEGTPGLHATLLQKKLEIEAGSKRRAVMNKVTTRDAQVDHETDASNSQRAGSTLCEQQSLAIPGQFPPRHNQ